MMTCLFVCGLFPAGTTRLLVDSAAAKDEVPLCVANPSGNTSLVGKVVHWSSLLKAVRAMEDDSLRNTRLPK